MNSCPDTGVTERTKMSSQTSKEMANKESNRRTSDSNDLENLKFDSSDENSEESSETLESNGFPDLAPSKSIDFPDGADPLLI
jgi:hypothetical protein